LLYGEQQMSYQNNNFVNDHILSDEQLDKLIREKFERLREQYGYIKTVDNKDDNVLES
jgi:hypothetical protein